MRIIYYLVGVLIFNFGCQKGERFSKYKWSSNQDKNKPTISSEMFGSAVSSVRVFDEIVEVRNQQYSGARVLGSFLQTVSDLKGQPAYIVANFQNPRFKSLAEEIERLKIHRFQDLEILKRKYLDLKTAKYIFDPEVVILAEGLVPRVKYKIDYIPKNSNAVFSLRVSSAYSIESISRVEHCFQESRSILFPEGPKLSDLMETILRPLIGGGTLASPKLGVVSEDGVKVSAVNGEFIFGTEDPRFDHVQAFFFAQKTLDYAERNWDLTLPFPIKIGLRAGYPQKMTTAYYYKGLIRLGDGDGVSYRNIPRDPSIVSHEVAHALIDAMSGMGSEGEAGILNEGFADYLTATIWENPLMGHTAFLKRPFTRTVDIKTSFSERNGGTYHDSGILSGTFWEIEKELGAKKSQKIALKTIVRLGANPQFVDLGPAVLDAIANSNLAIEDINKVRQILNTRMWPLENAGK